jgi:L-alanine-DL-glutamate epimerase-like enolase superfamily enzyme
MTARDFAARIENISVRTFKVPTDYPEADGTCEWESTTMIVVEVKAACCVGLGYTYADAAAARFIEAVLVDAVKGKDPFDLASCWQTMTNAVRNNGDTGLCRMAIAAVDNALWDLKARLLELPLAKLLGMAREQVPCYGSGGFISYSLERLRAQLGGWAKEGFSMVKMKIGSEPADDPARMAAAKDAIGKDTQLFVDANEAFEPAQALRMAELFPCLGITWYEQPLSHLDFTGMRRLRARLPAGTELADGEYIYSADDALRIIEARSADVLMPDATRCGITGFLQTAALCEAYHLPLSSHCAPNLHVHVCCSINRFRCMEYFHDHARIENMLFTGTAAVTKGMMRPDLTKPGMGLALNEDAAAPFEIKR